MFYSKKMCCSNALLPKYIIITKPYCNWKKVKIITDVILYEFIWCALVFLKGEIRKKGLYDLSYFLAWHFLQDSISLIVLLCRTQLLSFRNSLEIYVIIEFACINKHIINNQWQLADNTLLPKFNYMLD